MQVLFKIETKLQKCSGLVIIRALPFSSIQKNFGELFLPRTTQQKKTHLQILETVPFDMVEAVEERNKIEYEMEKYPTQFIKILRRHGSCPREELLGTFMKYVLRMSDLRKGFSVDKSDDPYVVTSGDLWTVECFWETMNESIRNLLDYWSAADVGLILRCIVKLGISYSNSQSFDQDFSPRKLNRQTGKLYKSPTSLSRSTQYFKVGTGMHAEYSIGNSRCVERKCLLRKDCLRSLATLLVERFFVRQRHEDFIQWGFFYTLQAIEELDVPIDMSVLEGLLSRLVTNKGQFTTLELLARVMHSLAGICEQQPHYNRQICDSLRELLAEVGLPSRIQELTSLTVHLTANSLARTKVIHIPTLLLLQQRCNDLQLYFTQDELSALANSFAKLTQRCHQSLFVPIFTVIGDRLALLNGHLTCRNIAVAANAFASVYILHQNAFSTFSKEIPLLITEFDNRQLAMLAHAYVRLGLAFDSALSILWDRVCVVIKTFDWQNVALILQSFTKSGASHPPMTEKLCNYLSTLLDLYDKYKQTDECSSQNVSTRRRLPQIEMPSPQTLLCISFAAAKGYWDKNFYLFERLSYVFIYANIL